MAAPQSLANHSRYYPLWHFFVLPVLAANMLVALRALAGEPSGRSAWTFVVSLALVGVALSSRTMCLVLQNRLVRLEERVRLRQLLPPDLQPGVASLRTDDLIGLRFASDGEVTDLVRRIQAGTLSGRKAIKEAVREWRPDTMRV